MRKLLFTALLILGFNLLVPFTANAQEATPPTRTVSLNFLFGDHLFYSREYNGFSLSYIIEKTIPSTSFYVDNGVSLIGLLEKGSNGRNGLILSLPIGLGHCFAPAEKKVVIKKFVRFAPTFGIYDSTSMLGITPEMGFTICSDKNVGISVMYDLPILYGNGDAAVIGAFGVGVNYSF